MRKLIVVLVALGWIQTANAGQEMLIIGYGAKPCMFYVKAYDSVMRSADMDFFDELKKYNNWITAFLVGYQHGTGRDILGLTRGMGHEWIRNWCRERPGELVVDGVAALIRKAGFEEGEK